MGGVRVGWRWAGGGRVCMGGVGEVKLKHGMVWRWRRFGWWCGCGVGEMGEMRERFGWEAGVRRGWPDGVVLQFSGKRRRRGQTKRSSGARQRLLVRREPKVIGPEEFTILHSNVRGVISRFGQLSARLRLMKSEPSVLCLTETWGDKGLPTMRIEGCKLISRQD